MAKPKPVALLSADGEILNRLVAPENHLVEVVPRPQIRWCRPAARALGITYDRREQGDGMEQTWTWSTTGYNFTGVAHDEIIDACRAGGLSGVEGAAELFPDETDAELEELARRYRDAGLGIDSYHLPFKPDDDIVCFYETTRRAAVDRMILHMERAAALRAHTMIQHPSTNRFSVDVAGFDSYLSRLERSLEALLPRAASLGLVIAIENMLPGADGPRVGSKPEHLS